MITEESYYELNNKGLSQSKIKDYAKCPNYFYRKNIIGELEKTSSKAFLIGGEVDSILTEVNKASNLYVFDGDFRTKANREMRDDLESKGHTVVKQAEYDQITAIANAVKATSIWKDVDKNFSMQEIFIKEDKTLGEHFDCLYGKPDAILIERDTCTLLDLKTSLNVDKRSFFYKAHDLGYFKQLWMYTQLIKNKYPEVKKFRYGFIVAEKSEPYKVVYFKVPVSMVHDEEAEMLDLIESISKNKDFKKADVNWTDGVDLTLEDKDEGWD